MPIPDFQTLMLPLLKLLSDGKIYRRIEIEQKMSESFALTPDELAKKVPSGTQGLFSNKLTWTRSYLKNAGLLHYPSRGSNQITEEGLAYLKTNPTELRMRQLEQFPLYQQWKSTFNIQQESDQINHPITASEELLIEQTPQENLAATVERINQQLASDILDTIKDKPFDFFERFVITLLQAMGYGGFRESSGRHTGQTGDEGIDGIIYQDRLGLEGVCIQAKRYTNGSVGSPEIRNFIGSLSVK